MNMFRFGKSSSARDDSRDGTQHGRPRADQRFRALAPPETVLLRALRDAPDGLTVQECRTLLRPLTGRTRLEQALDNVRDNPEVHETIEPRVSSSGQRVRQRVFRVGSAGTPDMTTALPVTEQATRPGRPARLIVTQGPSAGKKFVLHDEANTVGRNPGSDIFLDDATVSRQHAKFFPSGAQFSIQDAGSANGTFVNNAQVQQASLNAGDEVSIGAFRLVYLPAKDSPSGEIRMGS